MQVIGNRNEQLLNKNPLETLSPAKQFLNRKPTLFYFFHTANFDSILSQTSSKMRFITSTARLVVSQRSTNSFVSQSTRSSTRACMHSSAILRKGPPTQSEESVKHDKHNLSPEELQKETAKKSQEEFKKENHNPTASEEAAKADVDNHDPLPDHKKKGSSKP